MWNILLKICFLPVAIILWKLGGKMSETYDTTIPKWDNREMTAKEFYGKFIMFLGVISFVFFAGYMLRYFVK